MQSLSRLLAAGCTLDIAELLIADMQRNGFLERPQHAKEDAPAPQPMEEEEGGGKLSKRVTMSASDASACGRPRTATAPEDASARRLAREAYAEAFELPGVRRCLPARCHAAAAAIAR